MVNYSNYLKEPRFCVVVAQNFGHVAYQSYLFHVPPTLGGYGVLCVFHVKMKR